MNSLLWMPHTIYSIQHNVLLISILALEGYDTTDENDEQHILWSFADINVFNSVPGRMY